MSLKKTRRQHAQKTAHEAATIANHIAKVAQALAAPDRIDALDAALNGKWIGQTLGFGTTETLQALRDDLATLNGLPTKYRDAV